MKTNSANHFGRRYGEALRRHLGRRGTRGSGPNGAETLGREAVKLGLNTLNLVRLHDLALRRVLAATPAGGSPPGGGRITGSGAFLVAVLEPLEKLHRAGAGAIKREKFLNEALHSNSSALAVSRKLISAETALRRTSDEKLRVSEQHYSLLLLDSLRMQKESKRLAHQVLLAQEEDRKQISRELHDEVAQILAGINVQLAALKEASAINIRSLRQRIGKTQRLVEESVKIVHRYARELRPAMLDDLGLIPALRSFIRDLPCKHGLEIHFTAYSGVEALNNNQRTILYRVAQEALTNVTRHARATVANVRIFRIRDSVRMTVINNGRSFDVVKALASNTNNRLGLIGMRERVEMIGGRFSIESEGGHGTRIQVEIPFAGARRIET